MNWSQTRARYSHGRPDCRDIEFAAAIDLKQMEMNIRFHEAQMCSCLPRLAGIYISTTFYSVLWCFKENYLYGYVSSTLGLQRASYSNNIPKCSTWKGAYLAGMERVRVYFRSILFIMFIIYNFCSLCLLLWRNSEENLDVPDQWNIKFWLTTGIMLSVYSVCQNNVQGSYKLVKQSNTSSPITEITFKIYNQCITEKVRQQFSE